MNPSGSVCHVRAGFMHTRDLDTVTDLHEISAFTVPDETAKRCLVAFFSSKFSFLFHLRNHQLKGSNLKFWVKC